MRVWSWMVIQGDTRKFVSDVPTPITDIGSAETRYSDASLQADVTWSIQCELANNVTSSTSSFIADTSLWWLSYPLLLACLITHQTSWIIKIWVFKLSMACHSDFCAWRLHGLKHTTCWQQSSRHLYNRIQGLHISCFSCCNQSTLVLKQSWNVQRKKKTAESMHLRSSRTCATRLSGSSLVNDCLLQEWTDAFHALV
jgi:transposase